VAASYAAHRTDMKMLQAQLVFIAAVALLASASPATAQPVVPPGNSAVNQYTESFPTARGTAKTKRGERGDRSPAKVLGSRNARRLESQGPQGRELAAVVAAPAPTVEKSDGVPRHDGSASRAHGDDGSSGLKEIIAQATGSSDSGGMGIALPLLILVAFVGFAMYLWRRRLAT
jgi:hypothetical protein